MPIFIAQGETQKAIRSKLDVGDVASLDIVLESAETSAAAVLGALVKIRRPALTTLVLREGNFDGASEAPTKALVSPKITAGLASALPGLRSLTLAAHRLFGTLSHPALEELVLVGMPLGPALIGKNSALPQLRVLRIRLPTDAHGVALEPCALDTLARTELPALRELDLRGLVVDGDWEPPLAQAAWQRPELRVLAPAPAALTAAAREAEPLPWTARAAVWGASPAPRVALAPKPLAEWPCEVLADAKAVKSHLAKWRGPTRAS